MVFGPVNENGRLGDVVDISRDTLDDLSRVNQERKDRVRLLDREPVRR